LNKPNLVLIKDIELQLKELNSNLLERIDVKSFDCESSIPFKTYDLINGLLYRSHDLASTSFSLIKQKDTTSALLLTKALIESIAGLEYLSFKMGNLSYTKNLESFESVLKSMLFGNSNDEIVSMVNSLIDRSPELASSYSHIDEHSYPDFAGSHGLYAKMNMKEFFVEYEKNINEEKLNSYHQGLQAIHTSLELLESTYKKILEDKENFIALF
jgi:hypothetical protein